jgi:hypothetical protein
MGTESLSGHFAIAANEHGLGCSHLRAKPPPSLDGHEQFAMNLF